MMKTINIPDCVKNRLIYNPDTGLFTWSYLNKMHPRLNGKKAGCIRGNYLVIKIDSYPFRAHRLAWFIHTGEQPYIIDHINGNTTDNRICNLRNVTHSENAKNHAQSLNKSGLPCGVRLLPSGMFQSRVTCNKKVHNLGVFSLLFDAENACIEKRTELFGEFSRGVLF